MMRKALLLVLTLVAVLARPAAAAEKAAASCPALVQAPSDPTAASLAKIFGTVPAPKRTSGTVDCGQCPGGTAVKAGERDCPKAVVASPRQRAHDVR